MKKEDYMRLPKERLAELLEERDNEPKFIPAPSFQPITQGYYPLCYEPGGTCTNPQMDCVNCPRHFTTEGFVTTTGTGFSDNK